MSTLDLIPYRHQFRSLRYKFITFTVRVP